MNSVSRSVVAVAVAQVLAGSAHAALAPVRVTVVPTPSGVIDTRYRDGDDGTTAIPLLWGGCPAVNLTVGSACTTNLRTACNLIEAGSPTATLSLLSGTLPAGCSISGNGITGTVSGASSSSVVVRATRNSDVADTAPFVVAATASGTDTTAPTVPLGLAGVDNTDGTATLSWLASGDPSVSGTVTGVASYQVKLGGAAIATVTAPSANVQPALTAYEVGSDTGEASSQSGADWTITYSGAGLGSTTDGIYGRWAPITGDYVATMGVTSYTPTTGTSGSVGIAARASNSAAGAQAVYSRWRDSDDKCNLRYRGTTDGAAANGTLSSATYAPGALWIRQERTGDNFSTSCSADGVTWTVTSTLNMAPGAALYVGPFVTSGSAGNAATVVVDDFAVTQSGGVSYTYTGAGGSFAVNAYDGITRSADSAAVTVTPTGGTPGGGGDLSIPAMTSTCGASGTSDCSVCTAQDLNADGDATDAGEFCTFSPSQLSSIFSSAANAAAMGINAGDVIELRTLPPGDSETWETRVVVNSVNGTSSDAIWLTVRDGDQITLESSFTNATMGQIQFDSASYWNVIGSRDGTFGALKISDASRLTPACSHFSASNGSCWINRHALKITGSTGIAFVGVDISGGSDFHSSEVDETSSRILFKNSRIGNQGSNAVDAGAFGGIPDGVIDTSTADGTGTYSALDSDGGEAMTLCSQRTVLEDVTLHHSGHTPVQPCGPYQVWRRVTADMNWLDETNYPMYTGNHSMVIKPVSAYGINGWNKTLFGPLIEDSLLINAGTEPEHKEWIESAQIEGYNVIFRGNYVVQRQGPAWFGTHSVNLPIPACGVGKGGSWTAPYVFIGENKIYNNTVWGGSYSYTTGASGRYSVNGGLVADTSGADGTMAAGECANQSVKNNLFQGVQVGRSPGKRNTGQSLASKHTYVASFTPVGSYTGWANHWKGMQFFGNVWGKHPADPPSDTYYKFYFNNRAATSLFSVNNGVDANSDWDCADGGDSGTWPANYCGNRDQQLTWANGTLTPLTAVPSVATDPSTVRSALTLSPSSPLGIGDAWPMTYVATADGGSGVTLVLDDARWIYDGWDIDDYDWDGLHTEHPDCIAIGATVGASSASATVVKVSAATDLSYTTNTVTLASGVTRVDGAPVWPAKVNADGSCGAVWDNRGAAQ